jgi:tetratricopeptide (TPR) repeat protein
MLRENPALYQLHTSIGNVHKAQGNLDQAVAEYRLVLEQDPSNSAALVSAGDALAKQGKFDEALPYFEKAVEINPLDEAVAYNVAELCFNSGNVAKAVDFYKRATAIKPDWATAHLKTGYAHLNLGQLDEAAAEFQMVLEVAPGGPEAAQAQAALSSLGK